MINMKYRIYKYVFELDDSFQIALPQGSKILKIGKQPGHPRGTYCMWASVLIAEDNPVVERRFNVYGTGHVIDTDASQLNYIDSIIDDIYVWHFFEVL